MREVHEETGIRGKVLAELGSIDYWFVTEGRRVHKTVHHYLLRYLGGELSDADIEVTEVAWVPPDRAALAARLRRRTQTRGRRGSTDRRDDCRVAARHRRTGGPSRMTLLMHRTGAAVLVVLALVFATIGGTVVLTTIGGAAAHADTDSSRFLELHIDDVTPPSIVTDGSEPVVAVSGGPCATSATGTSRTSACGYSAHRWSRTPPNCAPP